MNLPKSYATIERLFSKISAFNHLRAIGSWDQAVNMPEGGVEARAMALSEVTTTIGDLLRSSELGDALAAIQSESNTLTDWQLANVREAKRHRILSQCVDPVLIEKKSELEVHCEYAWRASRANNNWAGFLPQFKKLLHLVIEEARQRGQAKGCLPYDAMLDLHEPGLTTKKVDLLFSPLKPFLIESLPVILDQQKAKKPLLVQGTFPIAQQQLLGIEIMKSLGFDFNHGRLDISTHPFCGGTPEDVRITTRFSNQDFTSSMMGIIHETGHAMYEQNLPASFIRQPVGHARGMASHESQSLFMEMQVARSKPFLRYLAPKLTEAFPAIAKQLANPDALFDLFTLVKPDYIRVEADEVTYPFHIILRYEIEKDLIEETIQPEDIPNLWHEKMKTYLNLTTMGDDRNGCLQDIHWPSGAFGYFPSYTIGAMIAAQLHKHLAHEIKGIGEAIASGQFTSMTNWLKECFWSKGCYYESFDDLCKNATGKHLDPSFFIDHLKDRYLNRA